MVDLRWSELEDLTSRQQTNLSTRGPANAKLDRFDKKTPCPNGLDIMGPGSFDRRSPKTFRLNEVGKICISSIYVSGKNSSLHLVRPVRAGGATFTRLHLGSDD